MVCPEKNRTRVCVVHLLNIRWHKGFFFRIQFHCLLFSKWNLLEYIWCCFYLEFAPLFSSIWWIFVHFCFVHQLSFCVFFVKCGRWITLIYWMSRLFVASQWKVGKLSMNFNEWCFFNECGLLLHDKSYKNDPSCNSNEMNKNMRNLIFTQHIHTKLEVESHFFIKHLKTFLCQINFRQVAQFRLLNFFQF